MKNNSIAHKSFKHTDNLYYLFYPIYSIFNRIFRVNFFKSSPERKKKRNLIFQKK